MWLESLSEPAHDAARCPACGGHVRRRSYGEMHAGSYVLNGERVDIRATPAAGFSDPIWLDPLTQYFDGGLYRLWPGDRYLSRGGRKIHRDVWRTAFGPIPPGCHIHHKDGDRSNNRLGNLECVPERLHLSDAWRVNKSHIAPGKHFTERARERASEWHQSEAGRLWHSRMAKRTESWTKWERAERACEFCGKPMQALVRKNGYSQRFCTDVCKAAAYRARDKTDMRECPACKQMFAGLRRPGLGPQKYCSVKCKDDAHRGSYKTQSGICPQCGVGFVARFHKNKAPKIYCTRACADASRGERAAARRAGGRLVPDGS